MLRRPPKDGMPEGREFRLISSANYHDLKVTTKIENVEPPPSAVPAPARAPALHFHTKEGGSVHRNLRGEPLKKLTWLVMVMILAHWTLAAGPAAAQDPGAAPLLEQPAAPPAEEKKEEAPNTCGPLLTDTCIPIEEHHASMQVLWGLSFYPGNFSPNWRYVSAHGDFYTFNMPVKFTYGPAKNLETYIVAPFVVNWVNNVDRGAAGPNGEHSASYAGMGDITTVAKYLVLEEGDVRPAVTLVGGWAGPAATPRSSTRGSWVRTPSAPGLSASPPASTCTNG